MQCIVQRYHNVYAILMFLCKQFSAYVVIIPAKAFARDYVITGVRCLAVCLLQR